MEFTDQELSTIKHYIQIVEQSIGLGPNGLFIYNKLSGLNLPNPFSFRLGDDDADVEDVEME